MMTNETGIRKDREDLRFGLFSGLIVLAVLAGQTALSPKVLEGLENLGAQSWVGLMWGGWALSLWIFGNRPITVPKACVLACLFVWHSAWMSLLREQPIHRYWIMLGFFAFTFVAAGEFLGIPSWHKWTKLAPPTSKRRGQFGIFAILMTTSAVAVVMFAIKQYDEGSDRFLQGTVVVSCLLVVIAQLAMHSATSWTYPWLGAIAVIGAAWGASWLLALQDQDDRTIVEAVETLWPIYQIISTVYGLVIWGAGMCGRWDNQVLLDDEVPRPNRHLDVPSNDIGP